MEARPGHRSAAEFIAARSGSSVAAARAHVEVSKRLTALPATGASPRRAVRCTSGRGRRRRDREPGRGGATARARTACVAERAARRGKARAEGRREGRRAYAFDALVQLAKDRTKTRGARSTPSHLTLIRVDLEALRRGRAHDGEQCEISGIGPIPAGTARELLGESILKLVITKGVDVLNVTHLGRGPTAAQRVALLWSSPTCSVEACARARVEIDHRVPYSASGHTRLDELDPLCKRHHQRKHHDGWALVEGTGNRPMVPPEDPRHPKNRPGRDTS
jgi:hypothetical protein